MQPQSLENPALFVSIKGSRISVRSVERMVNKYRCLVSPKKVSCHKLRTTYASGLIEAGASVLDIQASLGHKRLETSGKYLAVSQKSKQRAAEYVSLPKLKKN